MADMNRAYSAPERVAAETEYNAAVAEARPPRTPLRPVVHFTTSVGARAKRINRR